MSSSSSKRSERILTTRIDSCFKCHYLDFSVDMARRNRYIMNCKHPTGHFTWKDVSHDVDHRPGGLIPKQCPLKPVIGPHDLSLKEGGAVK